MKKAAALAVLVLASVALVACGSSSSNSTTSSEAEAAAAAPKSGAEEAAAPKAAARSSRSRRRPGTELAYTTKSATAKAGQVSIEFTNPQELQHDVAIEDSSGKVLGETELVAGGSATTTVRPQAGRPTPSSAPSRATAKPAWKGR